MMTPVVPTAPVVRGGATATVRLILGTQQIIKNMNNSCDITFRLAVGVLQGWVQGARESAGVHTLAMMVHGLDYGSAVAGR